MLVPGSGKEVGELRSW